MKIFSQLWRQAFLDVTHICKGNYIIRLVHGIVMLRSNCGSHTLSDILQKHVEELQLQYGLDDPHQCDVSTSGLRCFDKEISASSFRLLKMLKFLATK